ncbi:MAG: tyrosine recombinase [Planctomycetes bacterium]|nr:tyrosine recombinase [Planctomycetota bacterium]
MAAERAADDLDRVLRAFGHYLRVECGLAENTIRAYGADLGRLAAWLRRERVLSAAGIEEAHVAGFLRSERRRGLSPRSVARSLIAVRMLLRFLVGEGEIGRNVARWIDAPRLWQTLPEILTQEETERLLEAASRLPSRHPLRNRALLEFLYASGARVSEATALRLEDLRLDLGCVRLFGKGSKERIVPIHARARETIERYVREERPREVPSRIVFATRTGGPLRRENVWRLIDRCRLQAGIVRKVTPHTLRHSYATHLLQNGADLRVVQELLGHARISTTEVYTHIERSSLKAVHRKFHPRG